MKTRRQLWCRDDQGAQRQRAGPPAGGAGEGAGGPGGQGTREGDRDPGKETGGRGRAALHGPRRRETKARGDLGARGAGGQR